MPRSERLRLLDEIIHEWTVSSWILEVKMLMLVVPLYSRSGGWGETRTDHDLMMSELKTVVSPQSLRSSKKESVGCIRGLVTDCAETSRGRVRHA